MANAEILFTICTERSASNRNSVEISWNSMEWVVWNSLFTIKISKNDKKKEINYSHTNAEAVYSIMPNWGWKLVSFEYTIIMMFGNV